MGYAVNLAIPAAAVGQAAVPISVSGDTIISFAGDYELSYDENGFNTGQFMRMIGGETPQVLKFSQSGKTILWIRQPPAGGGAILTMYVWSEMGEINL